MIWPTVVMALLAWGFSVLGLRTLTLVCVIVALSFLVAN